MSGIVSIAKVRQARRERDVLATCAWVRSAFPHFDPLVDEVLLLTEATEDQALEAALRWLALNPRPKANDNRIAATGGRHRGQGGAAR